SRKLAAPLTLCFRPILNNASNSSKNNSRSSGSCSVRFSNFTFLLSLSLFLLLSSSFLFNIKSKQVNQTIHQIAEKEEGSSVPGIRALGQMGVCRQQGVPQRHVGPGVR